MQSSVAMAAEYQQKLNGKYREERCLPVLMFDLDLAISSTASPSLLFLLYKRQEDGNLDEREDKQDIKVTQYLEINYDNI